MHRFAVRECFTCTSRAGGLVLEPEIANYNGPKMHRFAVREYFTCTSRAGGLVLEPE